MKVKSILFLSLLALLFSCTMGNLPLENSEPLSLEKVTKILKSMPTTRGPNDGLVNKYTFDNNLAPVTLPNLGNTFFTVGNAQTYVDTATGQSAIISGSHAILMDSSQYNITGDAFSLSLWIKTSQSNVIIIKKHNGTKGYTLSIGSDGKLVAEVSDGTTTLTTVGNDVITGNQWTLATLAYWKSPFGADFLFVYTNTTSAMSYHPGSLGDITNTSLFTLGESDNSFLGQVETLRLYNNVVKAVDISTLYATENPKLTTPIIATLNRLDTHIGTIEKVVQIITPGDPFATRVNNVSTGVISIGGLIYSGTRWGEIITNKNVFCAFDLSSIPQNAQITSAKIYTTYSRALPYSDLYEGRQDAVLKIADYNPVNGTGLLTRELFNGSRYTNLNQAGVNLVRTKVGGILSFTFKITGSGTAKLALSDLKLQVTYKE